MKRSIPVGGVLVFATALAVTALALGQEPVKKVSGNVIVKAQFTAATKTEPARLFITAQVEKGWHMFSITQKKGGPIATKLKLPTSPDYRLLADQFSVSPAPKVYEEPEIWPDLPLEEHSGTVTWYVPIELSPGVDPEQLKIEGKLYAQRCKESTPGNPGSCVPPKDFAFVAELGTGVEIEESDATEK